MTKVFGGFIILTPFNPNNYDTKVKSSLKKCANNLLKTPNAFTIYFIYFKNLLKLCHIDPIISTIKWNIS